MILRIFVNNNLMAPIAVIIIILANEIILGGQNVI